MVSQEDDKAMTLRDAKSGLGSIDYALTAKA
jgi:hypothetical protein